MLMKVFLTGTKKRVSPDQNLNISARSIRKREMLKLKRLLEMKAILVEIDQTVGFHFAEFF